MEIAPRSSVIGAELRAIDLGAGVGDGELEASNQVPLDYQVIFFRDQQLSPRRYAESVARPCRSRRRITPTASAA